MAKPKMQTDYLSAVKKAKLETPFSLLPPQIPENSGDYKYKLRKSTVATTVRLYQPILGAIRMYSRNAKTELDTPYLMIERNKVGTNAKIQKECLLETIDEDGFTLLISVSEDRIRISRVNPADVNDREPVLPFAQQSTRQLTAITLALMPQILKIDDEKAEGVLGFTVAELGPDLEDAATWTDVSDIRDLVKEHLYFTDAAYHALNNLELNFGDVTSTAPEEIDASFFHQPAGSGKASGAVICENLVNGWEPSFIASNGAKAQSKATKVTIDLAKQSYAAFSAHRNWTAAEKAMIPSFPDNMPVMGEVLEMANAIVNTVNDPEPIKNIMWRSDTGYGKSTGTKQLACILNVPYLVITCHPGMELTEFKSNFVPNTEGAVELDMSTVTAPASGSDQDVDRPPFFAEAVAFLSSLDEQQRSELFDAPKFYCSVMLEDPQELAGTLIGTPQDISLEDLCWLYGEVRTAMMREEPLRKKVRQLEVVKAPEDSKKETNKPEFVHVVSQYIRALVNGYIIEIQEASRIRDSGVLVGLNEYSIPGAVIPLLNGGLARRHKDAICIITDNVGYASCRPIDPSVIRRQDLIIDSDELTKAELVERVKYNTGCKDNQLIDLAYSYWNTVRTYCQQNTITEGSTSPMELVRFVQALMHDGIDSLERDLNRYVISKATSNIEDQRDIRTACQTARVS